MNFKYASNPITPKDLEDVERRFGFEFPDEFRSLYLIFNGGRPEKDRFVNESGTWIVDALLPIKQSNSALSIIERSLQDVGRDKHLLPNFLVPFGIDPFGNYYCFSTRQHNHGAIYFVDMDRGDCASEAEFLSPSLGEFLSKLTAKS